MKAIHFKILQRRLKFRNPTHLVEIPEGVTFDRVDVQLAQQYLELLHQKNIRFTYPGEQFYPAAFLKMKEPPLFLEYRGQPSWISQALISVVGSRESSTLTEKWLRHDLSAFITQAGVGVVSGGARGVDQLAHLVALKCARPSVFVLPSGLENMYPDNLANFATESFSPHATFISEFEFTQPIYKSHFYFRNRLIAALGDFTLVAQASLKSGSLLTVHHCLENGKPVLVIPAHPQLLGFDGNIKLLREGAFPIASQQDLLDFWKAEFHCK